MCVIIESGNKTDKKMKTNYNSLNFKIMKKLSFYILATVLTATFFFTSCEKDPVVNLSDESILPLTFGVDIPTAISQDQSTLKSAQVDTMRGNIIYCHLSTFIHVGDAGGEMVRDIIHSLSSNHINKAMSFSYEGDDDGRTKNLEIVENVTFDGETWEFQLIITDADSEGNADGGNAIQLFWNRNPIVGIAILKPYNIDRNTEDELVDAMFRVNYNEAGTQEYDAYMMVYVTGLPLENPLDNPYSMSTMKMFAGRKGDIVDVYGNSNHPNATFFAGNSGFNWTFVASSNKESDIGVAEIGLPPSNLDDPSRSVLLDYYSIKNVFTRELYEIWPTLDSASVKAFLYNTEAPGFFDTNGFIVGGTSPGSEFDEIENRLPNLSPYNPREITNLKIEFKVN